MFILPVRSYGGLSRVPCGFTSPSPTTQTWPQASLVHNDQFERQTTSSTSDVVKGQNLRVLRVQCYALLSSNKCHLWARKMPDEFLAEDIRTSGIDERITVTRFETRSFLVSCPTILSCLIQRLARIVGTTFRVERLMSELNACLLCRLAARTASAVTGQIGRAQGLIEPWPCRRGLDRPSTAAANPPLSALPGLHGVLCLSIRDHWPP